VSQIQQTHSIFSSNRTLQYRVHKNLLIQTILCQINPLSTSTGPLCKKFHSITLKKKICYHPSKLPVKYWEQKPSGQNIVSYKALTVKPNETTVMLLLTADSYTQHRALSHWYKHPNYHTTEHWHIGTDSDSITQQITDTLEQTLTLSHYRAMPHCVSWWVWVLRIKTDCWVFVYSWHDVTV